MPTAKRKTTTTWTNGAGQQVPIQYVPSRDKRATRLVARHIKAAMAESARLTTLHRTVLDEIDAFVTWSARQSGVKAAGGDKGNVDLTSFDGLAQIRVRRPEYIEFDERLQQAKTLIFEFLRGRAKTDADQWLVDMVMAAFTTTRDGRVRADAVLAVERRVKFKDPTWQRAMALIAESQQSVQAKTYIRFYRRPNTESDWQLIPLDIANAASTPKE